jgi:hypothetical protein
MPSRVEVDQHDIYEGLQIDFLLVYIERDAHVLAPEMHQLAHERNCTSSTCSMEH